MRWDFDIEIAVSDLRGWKAGSLRRSEWIPELSDPCLDPEADSRRLRDIERFLRLREFLSFDLLESLEDPFDLTGLSLVEF